MYEKPSVQRFGTFRELTLFGVPGFDPDPIGTGGGSGGVEPPGDDGGGSFPEPMGDEFTS